jgi:hypothetical protein
VALRIAAATNTQVGREKVLMLPAYEVALRNSTFGQDSNFKSAISTGKVRGAEADI